MGRLKQYWVEYITQTLDASGAPESGNTVVAAVSRYDAKRTMRRIHPDVKVTSITPLDEKEKTNDAGTV